MARHLSALAAGEEIADGPSQTEIMLELVEKYATLDVPAGCKPSPTQPSLRTVRLATQPI